MVSIICSSAAPLYLEEFRSWCIAEWGTIVRFESVVGMVIPPPVLVNSIGAKLRYQVLHQDP